MSSPPHVSTRRRAYGRVVAACTRTRGVAQEQKQGFGSGALKVNGRMFAMLTSHGDFVVKLPKLRIDELIASGADERFEPEPGRVMKEWLVFAGPTTRWVDLAREACAFVNRVSTKPR